MSGFETKEGLECSHGLPPAVVPKDELVEVDLELGAANAVVGANQPLLQVPDGSVGQGHDRFGTFAQFGPQGLSARDMFETQTFQACETLQPVGVDGRSHRHILHEEAVDGLGREVRDDGHAEAPRGPSPPLNCDQHECRPAPLQLATSSDARLGSTYPRVIDLDFAPEWFASHVDHGSAQLVEHHPGGFVTSEAKLALQEQCRDTPFVGGYQVGGPEPQVQRRLRIMKDGTRSQRYLMTAGGAFPAPSSSQRVAAVVRAARTDETLRPAALRQIFLAGLFGSVFELKLAECRRKGRTWHPT